MTEVVSWIVLAISSLALLSGAFFSIVGGWGLVKLPDFFSRLHGGGVTDTAGAGLILFGLMVYSGFTITTVKLIMILFFFVMTSPSACHALARSALNHGLKPELDHQADK